jgi:hypothetical protein
MLARDPLGYVPALARGLLARLQQRLALRLRASHLEGELSPRGA